MILPRPLASILLQLDPGRKAALAAETARSTSALGFGGDVELVFIYLFFTDDDEARNSKLRTSRHWQLSKLTIYHHYMIIICNDQNGQLIFIIHGTPLKVLSVSLHSKSN